ncbi:hypothetical protein OGAPHI_006769 [Ogataea philodendri]|uniref:t-SNARE coiled-coil homology domain-containing protein n=1 Tax=Ogataea philodendri TaxID=1378263 RepID=A0A9P8NY61_9ASCO|nr:uncharacterized protein OGAPHI_006769 [Ogataea philodendri]KAH3661362.1 hypothetical protein OGAPHI_006769 [Ogataea philodendri]
MSRSLSRYCWPRYSSKAHQREGRTALFSSTSQPVSASQSPSRQFNGGSATSPQDDPYLNGKSTSPYDGSEHKKKDYNASLMSQLESQNDETVGNLGSKIAALKSLSLMMGDEINKSKLNLSALGGDMDQTRNRIRTNFNKMVIMADKTGISWKIWLLFFTLVFWFFMWVWLA